MSKHLRSSARSPSLLRFRWASLAHTCILSCLTHADVPNAPKLEAQCVVKGSCPSSALIFVAVDRQTHNRDKQAHTVPRSRHGRDGQEQEPQPRAAQVPRLA